MRCENLSVFPGRLIKVSVLRVWDEPVRMAGERDRVASKAVTLRVAVNSPGIPRPVVVKDTYHAVDVDGHWTWILMANNSAQYKAGHCPGTAYGQHQGLAVRARRFSGAVGLGHGRVEPSPPGPPSGHAHLRPRTRCPIPPRGPALRAGNQDLAGRRLCQDAGCDVDGDFSDIPLENLDLSGVKGGPDGQTIRIERAQRGPPHPIPRAGPSNVASTPSPCPLHLDAPEPCQLALDDVIVSLEQFAPAPVAELGGSLGGADDVGEEDGHQHALRLGERSGPQ